VELDDEWDGFDGERARGVILYGHARDVAGLVVSVRLVRELGCTWPIEVRARGDFGPYATAVQAAGAELFAGDGTADGSVAASFLSQALILSADQYPVALPCRVLDEVDVSFAYWGDRSAASPVVVSPTEVSSLPDDDYAYSSLDLGGPATVGSAKIYRVDGRPRVVGRRRGTHSYWDGLGDPRLPHEARVVELLNEVCRDFPGIISYQPPPDGDR
jgi:hypothetical protein